MFFEEQFLMGEGRGTGRKDRHSSYPLGRSLLNDSFRDMQKQTTHNWHSLVLESERRKDSGYWEMVQEGQSRPTDLTSL